MRVRALIKRIFQQMFRDKRTLALLLIAPLFMLTLMHFIFNTNNVEPKIGVFNVNPIVIEKLENEGVDVTEYNEYDKDKIIEDDLDGFIEFKDQKLFLTLVNDDPSKSKEILMKVKEGLSPINNEEAKLNIDYIYGDSDTNLFDTLSPILVGFFIFFFVFLISGIGLLRERMTGTLERLISTPIKRWEVVLGYLIGYGLFAVIQTILIIIFSIVVLGITLEGSIWSVIIINLLLAIVALSLGILLSTFASSEFQMMQFIPIVVIPQIFFAGIFPIDGMEKWMQIIAKFMPLYYAAEALKGVMYQGLALSDYTFNLLILSIFAIIFILLNIFALRKYRVL